jgi:pimeloyl-ACP methyl ester carboxylesterase
MTRGPLHLVILALAATSVSGCFVTRQAVGEHPEWRKMVATPEQYGLRAETVTFVSADSIRLRAVWIASDSNARATIVLAHGQGGNRSYMLKRAAFLAGGGYNVVVLDLRDCGESGGTYTTPGYMEAEDVLAGVRYALRTRVGLPVVVLGHSAGAVAVLHAGRSSEVAAVIADAPFAGYRDMMRRVSTLVQSDTSVSRGAKMGLRLSQWPGMMAFSEWIFRLQTGISISPDRADARVAVKGLGGRPVLFLAGERDAIAPVTGVQELYDAAATGDKEIVILRGATHNTFGTNAVDYEAAVLRFLNSHFSRTSHDEALKHLSIHDSAR